MPEESLQAVLSIIGWLMIAATITPLVRAEHWAVRDDATLMGQLTGPDVAAESA